MTFCVGLTGTIASGKTTASQEFSKLGVAVINADVIARQLTSKGAPALKSIIDHFGTAYLLPNGELNRKALRLRIFEHPEEKKWLEQLLHPLIRQALMHHAKQVTSLYCIIEIPLLTHHEDYPYLHRVLLIDVPAELAIERVMQRDACDRNHALSILNQQPDRTCRLALADDIIDNSAGLEALQAQVIQLHQKYLKLARITSE